MKKKYTVIGLCEEQRHAFHVEAGSSAEAERICKHDHDAETSYNLVVAGVVEGHVVAVDEGEDKGLDAQQRESGAAGGPEPIEL